MGRLQRVLVLALVIAAGGWLASALAPWMDLEQEFGLPWMYEVRGSVEAPADVLIVALDEESGQRLGLSDRPRDWPRGLHAELVRYLSQQGARLIVFDLTFDAPAAQPQQDAQFAAAIGAAGNVLVSESLRKQVLPLEGSGGRPLASLVIESPTLPVAAIEEAVRGHAPFLLPKTSRVDAYWAFRDGAADAPTLPVLALQRYAEGLAPAARRRIDASLALLRASRGTAYLNLYGPPRSVRTLPYARVIDLARSGADGGFRDKAVFIGFSAASPAGQDRLRDDHRTVFSQDNGLNLSGVELAATAFANLLEGRPLRHSGMVWQVGVALAAAVVLAFVCHGLRPAHAVPAAAALALLYLGFVYSRFAMAASWWPSIIPVGVELPLALFAGTWLHYRDSRREREAIKQAFGYFLPSTMVDQLAHNLGAVTQANQVVFGACLASDVSRYTSLAEQLEPDQLGRLLNDYFAQLFVPVERSGGAVMDIVGDAMVAIWTAPTSDAAVRRAACEAALEILASLDRFNDPASGRPALATRFGLHCGDIMIGSVGASHHYEYRAVGDIVNTASRLQSLNKTLGTRLLASADTVEGLGALLTRPLGSFRLAGKATALRVVELRGLRAGASDAELALCERFAHALACHDARQWREASDRFAQILEHSGDDGPSRFYLARCSELQAMSTDETWSPTVALDIK
jgi:adenylate cyclase